MREIVSAVTEPVVVGGHTHRQFDRRLDGYRVINAGSVGSPYDGQAGAFWAVLGPDVELRRTIYDFDRAAERLRATAFPDADEMLRESLTQPVDPDEVAAFFEPLATAS